MLRYAIDTADRIVEIDGPWDEFAAANGAPGLTRAAVLAHPIAVFVAGPEMQTLLVALLKRVREGETIALPFRCDSPAERRELLFESYLRADGLVQCVTTARLRLLEGVAIPRITHGICPQCRAVLRQPLTA